MYVETTAIAGVLVVEPRVFTDDRGAFFELYHAQRYADAGIDVAFVQDNLSRSRERVIRGLHYQVRQPQAKLVSCVRGRIWDVAVDLRPDSPTFRQWIGVELSAVDRRQLFLPPGIAHGFCVLETDDGAADVLYKCSTLYAPHDEAGVSYRDPELAIDWPVAEPVLSPRDADLPLLNDAELPRACSQPLPETR